MATLEQWIADEGLSFSEVARRLELRSRASVGRIIRDRQASPEMVRRICKLTGGVVTPNDIFSLPVPSPHEPTGAVV